MRGQEAAAAGTAGLMVAEKVRGWAEESVGSPVVDWVADLEAAVGSVKCVEAVGVARMAQSVEGRRERARVADWASGLEVDAAVDAAVVAARVRAAAAAGGVVLVPAAAAQRE